LIPARYSYSWALARVRELERKHARATETVCKLLQITERNLAAFLATGDPAFPQIREFIHWVENWDNTCSRPDQYETDFKAIVYYLRRRGRERLADRLDEVKNRGTIKEQGSRGGG